MIRLLSKIAQDEVNKDFWQGFSGGLSLVFISGFGDKTFFLNMLYVSIKPFWEAFFVSFVVSELMNLMSVFLGKVLPLIISRDILDWGAIVIFFAFGIAMLIQGMTMKSEKLSNQILEEKREDEYVQIPNKDEENKPTDELGVFDSWWKYCIAYMVGELGDKSQIATIVVTAKYNFYGVFTGTAMAQLLLVITSMLLGKTISGCLTNKQISLLGAFVFLMFAMIYLIDKLFYFNFNS